MKKLITFENGFHATDYYWQVIVMHLGNLTVNNKFLFAGAEGTLASQQESEPSSTSKSMDYSYGK